MHVGLVGPVRSSWATWRLVNKISLVSFQERKPETQSGPGISETCSQVTSCLVLSKQVLTFNLVLTNK